LFLCDLLRSFAANSSLVAALLRSLRTRQRSSANLTLASVFMRLFYFSKA